jgi:hypothetical protein
LGYYRLVKSEDDLFILFKSRYLLCTGVGVLVVLLSRIRQLLGYIPYLSRTSNEMVTTRPALG